MNATDSEKKAHLGLNFVLTKANHKAYMTGASYLATFTQQNIVLDVKVICCYYDSLS